MAAELEWLPIEGVRLTHEELTETLVALRAAINGTAEDEPNRSHLFHIAVVLSHAIERGGSGAGR